MVRILLPIIFLLVVGCGGTPPVPPSDDLRITDPKIQSEVPCIITVEGVGARTNDRIWVFVIPKDGSAAGQFWAQPEARVDSDGHWHAAKVYIADCSSGFTGQRFDVVALANPHPEPKLNTPSEEPSAERRSERVTVIRK